MQLGPLSVQEALGLGDLSWPCGGSTGWSQEPSGSFSMSLTFWIVTRIFHGHFATQAVDNPRGPRQAISNLSVTSLTHFYTPEKRNVP